MERTNASAARRQIRIGVCLNADLTIIAVKIAPLAMRRRRCYPCSSCAVPNPAEFCKRLSCQPYVRYAVRNTGYVRSMYQMICPVLERLCGLEAGDASDGAGTGAEIDEVRGGVCADHGAAVEPGRGGGGSGGVGADLPALARSLRGRWGGEGLYDRRLGRLSARRAPLDEVAQVLALFDTRYWDFTAKHFHEKLVAAHGCERSYNWVRLTLQAHGRRRAAHRRGAHRRKRPRRALPGMMVHQDGSRHEWVAERWRRKAARRSGESSPVRSRPLLSSSMEAQGGEAPGRADFIAQRLEVVAERGCEWEADITETDGHNAHGPCPRDGVAAAVRACPRRLFADNGRVTSIIDRVVCAQPLPRQTPW